VIFAGTNGYLDNVPVSDVVEYEAELLNFLRSQHADLLTLIRDTKDLGDEAKGKLKAALETFGKQFA
jgi:F-type H+-transporting ATPase subunit alpha